jgi:hypothetical protein
MKMNNRLTINIIAAALAGVLIAGQLSFRDTAERSNDPGAKFQSIPHPDTLSFADEAVPLERWDVKERFDRELLFNGYNRANVLFLLKLANRYFPQISERLKANGVPDDFKYVCVAESNLLSGARSGVGATGFWQFMSGTAPGYGLKITSEVDERYDLAKSTDAAAAYLKSAYKKFGSWTAAAASYNMGQGGFNGQASYQGTENYYDLMLPEETNRYLFRILAFKYLLENAEALGYEVKAGELYAEVPSRTVTVTASIPNLAQFAKANGTTYKMLRQLNPWIRGRSLSVKGSPYEIKLPAE